MTLEAYSARLRDETDVDRLEEDLVSVVRETVKPERASLWLRRPEDGGEKVSQEGFSNAFRNGGETVGA